MSEVFAFKTTEFRHNAGSTFHVIRHRGECFMTSAEISSIFRPDAKDLLSPLMMIKDISFDELVVWEVDKNFKLFNELHKFKVKWIVWFSGLQFV